MFRSRVVPLALLGLTLVLLIMLSGSGPTIEAFEDNRVNCHAASPIAIYCTNDQDLDGDGIADDRIVIYDLAGQEYVVEVSAPVTPPEVGEIPLVSPDATFSNPTVYLLSDGRYKVSYINYDRDPVEEFVAYWVGCGVETAETADLKSYVNGTEILLSDADGCGEDGFLPVPVEHVCKCKCKGELCKCDGTGRGGKGGQGGGSCSDGHTDGGCSGHSDGGGGCSGGSGGSGSGGGGCSGGCSGGDTCDHTH
ncbi:hypothetical protein ACFLYO_02415 [Chloroflexota bacterium]